MEKSVEKLLVQQDNCDALEKTETYLEVKKWLFMKKKAVSTFRLVIALKIKYNYLKDMGVLTTDEGG